MTPQETLRNIRKSKGISTHSLAEISGLSQSTISKIENGKRKFDAETMEILASALNIKIQDFFVEETSSKESFEKLSTDSKIEIEQNLAKASSLNKEVSSDNSHQDLTEDYNNLMNKIAQNKGGALFFNGVNLEGENMELFEDALKIAIKTLHLKK